MINHYASLYLVRFSTFIVTISVIIVHALSELVIVWQNTAKNINYTKSLHYTTFTNTIFKKIIACASEGICNSNQPNIQYIISLTPIWRTQLFSVTKISVTQGPCEFIKMRYNPRVHKGLRVQYFQKPRQFQRVRWHQYHWLRTWNKK